MKTAGLRAITQRQLAKYSSTPLPHCIYLASPPHTSSSSLPPPPWPSWWSCFLTPSAAIHTNLRRQRRAYFPYHSPPAKPTHICANNKRKMSTSSVTSTTSPAAPTTPASTQAAAPSTQATVPAPGTNHAAAAHMGSRAGAAGHPHPLPSSGPDDPGASADMGHDARVSPSTNTTTTSSSSLSPSNHQDGVVSETGAAGAAGQPAASSNNGAGAGAGAAAADDDVISSTSAVPALPAPGEVSDGTTDKTTTLEVDGKSVALDHLGPMVVARDGTISRISNWGEMTEIERQNTLRILGKRNQLRLANLRQGAGAGKDEKAA